MSQSINQSINQCPLLSVVIPMYNAEKYIINMLQSIVSQNCMDCEVIVVDDGSTDNSYELCQNFAKNYPFIKLYKQNNSGVCAARNKGIDLASGQYVHICDHDDIIAPHSYDYLSKYLNEFSPDMLAFDYARVTVDGVHIYERKLSYEPYVKLDRKYIEEVIVPNSIGIMNKHTSLEGHWTVISKRKFLNRYNIRYNEKMIKEEDKRFVVNMLAYANSLVYIPKLCYYWITRASSLSSKFSPRFENFLNNFKFYEKLFGEKYDYLCQHRINYNIDCLEDALVYYIYQKDNVDNLKELLLKTLSFSEVKLWFKLYSGSDKFRLKIKKYYLKDNVKQVYNSYKLKFLNYTIRYQIKKLLYKIKQ